MIKSKKTVVSAEPTVEELTRMIVKDQFPTGIRYSQKVEIRDLYLEGKTYQAINKLKTLLTNPLPGAKSEKTLL